MLRVGQRLGLMGGAFRASGADLVFVEFTMNDGQNSCEVTTDGRRGFEVLMRKLLNYPRGPAVIVLHWWSPVTQVRCRVDAMHDTIPALLSALKSVFGRLGTDIGRADLCESTFRVRAMSASRSYFVAASKYSCGSVKGCVLLRMYTVGCRAVAYQVAYQVAYSTAPSVFCPVQANLDGSTGLASRRDSGLARRTSWKCSVSSTGCRRYHGGTQCTISSPPMPPASLSPTCILIRATPTATMATGTPLACASLTPPLCSCRCQNKSLSTFSVT